MQYFVHPSLASNLDSSLVKIAMNHPSLAKTLAPNGSKEVAALNGVGKCVQIPIVYVGVIKNDLVVIKGISRGLNG